MSETTRLSVFACGGAGVNMLKKLMSGEYNIPKDVSLYAIDTSESNFAGLDKKVEQIKISAFGSGKSRKTNADLIFDQIERLDMTDRISDINIILTSLAGGSGSLIANILASRCANDDTCTINMGIVDMASSQSCENTINAIRSYENMAKKYQHYFPIALYSNANGRKAVNDNFILDLQRFIDLFNSDIEEIDHRDKVHFLNPSKIDSKLVGLYMIGITEGNELSETVGGVAGANNVSINRSQMIHATFAVNEDGIPVDVNTLVDYVGISSTMNYSAVNGVAINKQLTNALRTKAEQFRNRNVNQTEIEELDLGDTNENNGLII